MKKTKKTAAALLTIAMFALTPLTAMAASGYVPTKAISYYKENGEWVKSHESFSWSYKKNGQLEKFTYKYDDYCYTESYSWKGNHITKNSTNEGGLLAKYKYKGKKCVSQSSEGSKKSTYKWKKNKATYKIGDTRYTLTINSKGKRTRLVAKGPDGTVTTTYKYYGNGNLKSYVTKYPDGSKMTCKYNSKGYLTSKKGDYINCDYTYKTQSGKVKERIFSNGSRKIVYTKWKKVNNIINCDAFGIEVSPGDTFGMDAPL